MPHFDWYQATIAVAPQTLGEALLDALPGAHGFKAGRGRNNYHHSMAVLDSDGETLATVLHGGPNGDPNAWASGERAEAFAEVIRRLWPEAHRPTRIDSAADLLADYPTVRDRCRALAAPSRVSGFEIAAHGPEKGSTDYLGSKSARVQHRLYEKGKQMAGLVVDPSTVPANWLRLETQWRPDKSARAVASTVTPGEVWGVSPWVQAIAREVIGTNPERLRSRPKLLTDFERCHRAMLTMFGPHLTALFARHGNDAEAVGRLLLADLEVPL